MQPLRLVLLASTAALLVAGATIACSSDSDKSTAAPEETPLPDRNEDENKEPTPPAKGDEQEAPVNPGIADAGSDAPVMPKGDADVGDGSAGQLCEVGDVKESESNDTDATADPVSGVPSSFCGRLAAGEVDHLTFTLNVPQFKTTWSFSSAPITATGEVEGQTFDLGGNQYVYKQGKQYLIKITAAQATDYRIKFDPL